MCLIDMDTKTNDSEKLSYNNLKSEYNKTISDLKNGILCDVIFYESHLCTELFFLYYFDYTSKYFNCQEKLIEELNKKCCYEKTTKFFLKCKGLHSYLEKKGGKLEQACKRGIQSVSERDSHPREYTYSEIGKMIEKLDELYKQSK